MNPFGPPGAARRLRRSSFVAMALLAAVTAPACRRASRAQPRDSGADAQPAPRDAGWTLARSIFVRAIESHRRFVEDRRPMRHTWGEREVEAMLAALSDPAVALELAAVHPYRQATDGGPQVESGHQRLSSSTLTDARARAALGRALIDAVERSNGMAAMCFNPRHAVTLTVAGQKVSWIICLECLQIQLWIDGEFSATVTIESAALASHLPASEGVEEPVSPFVGR
jgi:hypothetical protein